MDYVIVGIGIHWIVEVDGDIGTRATVKEGHKGGGRSGRVYIKSGLVCGESGYCRHPDIRQIFDGWTDKQPGERGQGQEGGMMDG